MSRRRAHPADAALGVAALLVPWALLSIGTRADASTRSEELEVPPPEPQGPQPTPQGLWFLAWLGLGGLVTSMISFGTQWAHTNAYIPGLFFPSLAIGVAAGRLLHRSDEPRAQTQRQPTRPRPAPGPLWGLLAASLYPRMRSLNPAPISRPRPISAAGDARHRKAAERAG